MGTNVQLKVKKIKYLKPETQIRAVCCIIHVHHFTTPPFHTNLPPLVPLFRPSRGVYCSPYSNFQFCVCLRLSLSVSACLLFFTSLSVLLSDTPPFFLLLPAISPFSSFISMVVSRLGPPGLGAGTVWAAYTTVFIPLSSSLYSSKALHFFSWVSE